MDVLLPIIILLNASYLYFWLVVLYARAHKHIDRTPVANREIENALAATNGPCFFTIQITTKGGNFTVVSRGINYALTATRRYPILKKLLIIEVITEDAAEAKRINSLYKQAPVKVRAYVLPADYETPQRTQLKARALHYMVELHRKRPRDAYIIHYDEESVLLPKDLARLVRNLLKRPVGVSEGSISYPLEWTEAHPLCRAMGALQGVAHVRTLPGWEQMSGLERMKIQYLIRLRIFTYAVGLPISIISLTSWLLIFAYNALLAAMGAQLDVHLTWFAVPGLVMWLGGTQLGLAQNLRTTRLTARQKLQEHLNVLIRTPVAGLYDTYGPAVALVKWCVGIRGVAWSITPKRTGHEAEEIKLAA